MLIILVIILLSILIKNGERLVGCNDHIRHRASAVTALYRVDADDRCYRRVARAASIVAGQPFYNCSAFPVVR